MPTLHIENLHAYYGGLEALHGISLDVGEYEIVALLGSNGAGKTTTMRAISRTIRTTGVITFGGDDLTRRSTHAVVRDGIGHVPEGKGTFVDMTVEENLRLGMLGRPKALRDEAEEDRAAIYEIFPRLYDLRFRIAGMLSGGEQQMLAISRTMLLRPKILLLDEPSIGLAPKLVTDMYDHLRALFSRWQMSALVAEQSVYHALRFATRAYILGSGRVVEQGTSTVLMSEDNGAITAAYMGASPTKALT